MKFLQLSSVSAGGVVIASLPDMSRKVKLLSLAAGFVLACSEDSGQFSLEVRTGFHEQNECGTSGSHFGADVAFYLFELPLFRSLQGFGLFAMVVALLM